MPAKAKKTKVLNVSLAPTLKDHWYYVNYENGTKDLFPSVTTRLHAFPQNAFLTKWIAEQGYHESQEIKEDAGRRGTQVHDAIELLLTGGEVNKDSFALLEWYKISKFIEWYRQFSPKILHTELPLVSKKFKYAGKVDCIMKLGDGVFVVDWKTSSSVHSTFALQTAAYANAIEEMGLMKVTGTAVLQLGAKNKDGYRFITYPDWKEDFKTFKAVSDVFDFDFGDEKPMIIDLPQTFKL